MKNIPFAVTAASVAAFMGAQANAVPTGNPMSYAQDIVITGGLTGTGSGSGSGFFDDQGAIVTLNVSAVVNSLGTVVTNNSVYQGTVAGTTWTSNGTTTTALTSCGGNALICGIIVLGTTTSTGGAPFSIDIINGGAWSTVSTQGGGLINLNVDHTLTPNVSPPAGPSDPNAIPTMPIYGLGITAIALFGAAARRLRASRKTR